MRLALLLIVGVLAACSPPADEPVAAPQAEADPAVYRGAAIAGQVCAQCHDVGTGAPVQAVGAPDFRDIAGRPASTLEGLAAWMRANHPQMPNYMFIESDLADLAAYIVSLRPTGR